MLTSLCPRCRTQFVYWDDEDLDENGDLLCFCDEALAVGNRVEYTPSMARTPSNQRGTVEAIDGDQVTVRLDNGTVATSHVTNLMMIVPGHGDISV